MPETTESKVSIIVSNIRKMRLWGFAMNGVCKILLCVLTKQFLLSGKKLHAFKGKGFECLIVDVDKLVKSFHSNENRR